MKCNVSQDEVKENISTQGKIKLTSFPKDHTLSVLLYIKTLIKEKQTNKDFMTATTA